jgi:hypothetical protein
MTEERVEGKTMIQTVSSNLVSKAQGGAAQAAKSGTETFGTPINDTYTSSSTKAGSGISPEEMMRQMSVYCVGSKRPLTNEELKQEMALVRNMPAENIKALYDGKVKICICDPDSPDIPVLKDDKGNVVKDESGNPIKCPPGGWPGGIKSNWAFGAYFYGAKSDDGDKVIAFPKAKLTGQGPAPGTGDSLAMAHEMGHAIDDLLVPDVNARVTRIWTNNLNQNDANELKGLCRTSYDKGNWWAKSHLGGSLADRSMGEYVANGFMMLYSTPENRDAVIKNDPGLVSYTRKLENELKKVKQ